MGKSKRKPITWSTHFWVVAYTLAYMLMTILYCLPRLLIQFISAANATWISDTATSGIPLQIFSWGLFALCAGYAGIDRAALATKSSLMEVGTCDMGDPKKLRRVIYLLSLVFVESVVLNFFFGEDFTRIIPVVTPTGQTELIQKVYTGLNLPLEGVSSALVSTIVVYVLGNKSIRLTQNMDRTKKDEDWADERNERVVVDDPKEKKKQQQKADQ